MPQGISCRQNLQKNIIKYKNSLCKRNNEKIIIMKQKYNNNKKNKYSAVL